MKKLLIVTLLAFGISSVPTMSAHANDDAAYFLGGMLGGMILNEALNPRPRYYERAPVVVYDEPVYERVCTRRWVRVWDRATHTYVKVRRKQCQLVRIY